MKGGGDRVRVGGKGKKKKMPKKKKKKKMKVGIFGPTKSGKSTIANLLSGFSETPDEIYTPTEALRYFCRMI